MSIRRGYNGRHYNRLYRKETKFKVLCPRCQYGFLERRQAGFNIFDCDFCDYVAFFIEEDCEFIPYKYAPWRAVRKIPKKGSREDRAGIDVGKRIMNSRKGKLFDF